MRSFRFIGGHYDGQRLVVPLSPSIPGAPVDLWKMAVPQKFSNVALPKEKLTKESVKTKTVTYRREEFNGDKHRFYIFVEYNIPINDAIAILLGEPLC